MRGRTTPEVRNKIILRALQEVKALLTTEVFLIKTPLVKRLYDKNINCNGVLFLLILEREDIIAKIDGVFAWHPVDSSFVPNVKTADRVRIMMAKHHKKTNEKRVSRKKAEAALLNFELGRNVSVNHEEGDVATESFNEPTKKEDQMIQELKRAPVHFVQGQTIRLTLKGKGIDISIPLSGSWKGNMKGLSIGVEFL